MNEQISDLTNLVLALTEKISSSNREGYILSQMNTRHVPTVRVPGGAHILCFK